MSVASAIKAITSKLSTATSSLHNELSQLRAAIVKTQADLEHARSARLPVEEVVSTIIPAHVKEAGDYWLQQRGGAFVYGDRALAAPNVEGSRTVPWPITAPIPWHAFCAADPEGAARILTGLLRATPYEEGAPSAARPAMIERLTRQLAEQEAEEERFVDEAAEAGIVIAHRSEVQQRRNAEAERMRREAVERERRARLEAEINRRAAEERGQPRVTRSQYLETGQL
jgi:hypothetical protein